MPAQPQEEEAAILVREGPEGEERVARILRDRLGGEQGLIGDDQETIGGPAPLVRLDRVAQPPGEEAEEVARERALAGPIEHQIGEDEERFLAQIVEVAEGDRSPAPGREEARDLPGELGVQGVTRGGVGPPGQGERVEARIERRGQLEVPGGVVSRESGAAARKCRASA